MTQEQAINILITAANIAQGKGAFNLDEAATVREAILAFTKKEEVQPEKVEAEVVTETE